MNRLDAFSLLRAPATELPVTALAVLDSPRKPADTRRRARAIRVAICAEEGRLRASHPWLVRQDVLGLACFLLSLAGVAGAYLAGALTWWLAIPLMALPLSVLPEIEHDLIDDLYFGSQRWAQHLMFNTIWFCKLGLNPWYRRGIHLKHHRESGQSTDIEERLIGIGLPFGWLRLIVALTPFGSLALFPGLMRDAPDFRPVRLVLLSLPTYVIFAVLWIAFPAYLWLGPGLPPVFGPGVMRVGFGVGIHSEVTVATFNSGLPTDSRTCYSILRPRPVG